MNAEIKYLFLFFLLWGVNNTAQDIIVFTPEKSHFIPSNDTVLVFAPVSENKVPLLIMLHGYSGDYNQWNRLIDLKQYSENYKLIIACPDGLFDSWYVNSSIVDNICMEDFIIKTLLPELSQSYNVDTSLIFITGLSMGGHGAISLLLKYSNIFKAAGSTSGILDLRPFPAKWGMEKVLGSYSASSENWDKNSSIKLLESFDDKNLRLIIDCGTEDFAYDVNVSFMKKCKELRIPLRFISAPGSHTRNYWSESIKDHFNFFDKIAKGKNRR